MAWQPIWRRAKDAAIAENAQRTQGKPFPERCGINLEGMVLEAEVIRLVFKGDVAAWDMSDVGSLLAVLQRCGICVALQSFPSGNWQAVATFGDLRADPDQPQVTEVALESPTVAVARCAVAAARYWPEAFT